MARKSTCLPSRLRVLLVSLALLALLTSFALSSEPARAQETQPAFVPGEVLIGWVPGTAPVPAMPRRQGALGEDRADPTWQASVQEIQRVTGLTVLDASPHYGTARLQTSAGREQAEIARLSALPWVRYAELNYYAYAAGQAVYPNDPDFPRQWNMHRVKAPGAWAATRGSISFTVAVLDTGVAQGHPEFAGRLLAGRDYVNSPDSDGPEDDDLYGHGTHVTGIVAAGFNNAFGVAGLAPDVKVLPLKVLNSSRAGTFANISQAIRDAANSQAQVINLSLTSTASAQTLQDAVNYAQAQGALIVAAAGNCAQGAAGCGSINPAIYPAAYPGVLAVAASDRFDRPAPYSGYKPYIGLAAPGGIISDAIWSTLRAGYGYMYGTSMSTPMVSAAAALVWTLLPAASPQQIADILKNNADEVGTDVFSGEPLSYASGRNDYFGSGRLNVERAVRAAFPPSLTTPANLQSFFLGGGLTTQARTLSISNPSGQAVAWEAIVLDGGAWITALPANGTSSYDVPGNLTLKVARGALPPATYIGLVRIRSMPPYNLPSLDIPVQLRVLPTLNQTHLPLIRSGENWLDPNANGAFNRTVLAPGNDSVRQIVPPFPVRFYDTAYSSLQVSDNGLVVFGEGAVPATAPASCPGNGAPPNNTVYVLALDWNPTLGGEVTTHQSDSDTFVITWRGMRQTGNPLAQSFQLVIKRDGSLRGNYQTVASPLVGTIGVENYDATFAQQILCKGSGRQVTSGESLPFDARLPW